ncbi:cysteine desulfurase family protein [Photorhabdus bodei]|uniref:cysteine desulfurase n=1 Tax=Photorhabdus bodei TaxID=2029681 RepID=A0A329WVI7_9GAMM|nr:cysteine desulfurase family protein [Photorhabdus bodei]NDL00605.1 aminotransferase class V-fold PLP-dependent enzyme [Photorhabdus bodei]NDL04759.1 aminotransferase class V-fold PLP-dependent enzyme [Photorhabdus bodei]NDL09065.1 aminotransferase class V-fold PLP-dependent enzyme [Photorhabdus bodei]RAX08584.1 IscS subfamily cysteine desulfurase [Photorhabdus bodei]
MYNLTRPIYLDNNATTPLDPDVLQTMMPYFTCAYGNAASNHHAFGWKAMEAVENARKVISTSINAASHSDIIFTSGSTESNNLAIAGLQHRGKRGHVITSTIEHKAVLDCCGRLEAMGTEVTYLPPQSDGVVSPDSISRAIRDDTYLVSIMAANNEIGSIQKIEEIGAICKEHDIPLHTDATQALGKIKFDVQRMNISLASFSAHKIYGPKGVGALYIDSRNKNITLAPLIVGGGHERGLRSGTLNVPGIVGFGRAVELSVKNLPDESMRLRYLRDLLRSYIIENVADVRINGHLTECLPGLLNVSFNGLDADSLLLELSEVALSSGSACTSANRAPSHVLKAIGVSDAQAQASVRFGLGRFNNEDEIRYVCLRLEKAVNKLRSMAPKPFGVL